MDTAIKPKLTGLNPQQAILTTLPTKPLRVVYVSSFVPRQCGIATFTRDLTEHINGQQPTQPAQIIAMADALSEELPYGKEVKRTIKQGEWEAYQALADQINKDSSIDLVCLQHEYGIYGGDTGEYAAKFAEILEKPIVVTLHTILSEPKPTQRQILQRICTKSSAVVVMLEQGAKVLASVYNVPATKIKVIPHGVPHFSVPRLEDWKKSMDLENRVVMSSINLISSSKGIEYGIQALPEIVKQVPNFLYLVVGATHPVLLARANGRDEYREQLQKMINDLGVADHVRFINRYVSLDELVHVVAASDYYLTPYIDPQQVTSGALSYAIGAGKVCISTPYLYAKEMLNNNRGVLVPFKNHVAIAEAVVNLSKHPQEKASIESKTQATGKNMNWNNVARQYLELFASVID